MSPASLAVQPAPVQPAAGGRHADSGRKAEAGGTPFDDLVADRRAETGKAAEKSARKTVGTDERNLPQGHKPAAGRMDEPPAEEPEMEMPEAEAAPPEDDAVKEALDPVAALLSAVAPPPPAPKAHDNSAKDAPDEPPAAEAAPLENDRHDAQRKTEPARSDNLFSLLAGHRGVDVARAGAAAGPVAAPRAGPSEPSLPAQARPATSSGGVAADARQQARPEPDMSGTAVRPVNTVGDDEAPQAGSRRWTGGSSGQAEPRITITSVQVAPAPVAPVLAQPPSPTGAALVTALDTDGTLATYASETTLANPQGAEARPVTTLRLQLQPIELGNVNVKISGTGEEISIEVQVENSEARQRLSSDSGAIVKSLRGLGYDVERLTIQMVTPSAGGGQQQTATGGRGDGFAAFEQRDGERGGGQQNNSNPGGNGHDQHRGGAHIQSDRNAASGAVYI